MADGTRTASDQYIGDARDWYSESIDSVRRRLKMCYWITGTSLALALVSVFAVAALAPLKSVDSYVVTIDRSTGMVEPITNLRMSAGSVLTLTENEALTKANLAAYVVARETFDLADLQRRHAQVRRSSEASLFDEYDRAFRGPASINPFKLYEGSTREVRIKSVEFFNDRTGQVRFVANTKRDGAVVASTHFVAILQFRYVQIPTGLEDRLANPLGFQISSYRIDQESTPL